jgi:Family of unknown function (DUF5684)
MLALLAQSTTTTTTSASAGGAVIFGVIAILYVAWIVLVIASMWRLFNEAGQKGWCAIVPILNIIVLLKVVHKELWWIILFLIPCVSIVAAFIVYIDLAKAFGKNTLWGVGLILLPWITFPALAWGSSQYLLQPDPLF